MKVGVTPPHDGPGVLLVESIIMLYAKNYRGEGRRHLRDPGDEKSGNVTTSA